MDTKPNGHWEGDGELVEQPGAAAHAAWLAECARIQALRVKHCPSAPPFTPAAPNCAPIAKPTWLMDAQRAEMVERDKQAKLDQAEEARLSACDISRAEFEALLRHLGLESADLRRQSYRLAEMRRLNNAKRAADERAAAEDAGLTNRQREMRERAQADFVRLGEINQKARERE
jgi:hypothetical protein